MATAVHAQVPQSDVAGQPPPELAAPVPADSSTPPAQMPQGKIEKFADAYVAVESIQVKAVEQLQKASDAAQVDQVKANAENEMVQAVQRNGLSIDEFNQIVELMASDLALRSKVTAEIDQRKGGA